MTYQKSQRWPPKHSRCAIKHYWLKPRVQGQWSNPCLRQENKREFPDCAIIPEVGESPWLQVLLCTVPDQRQGEGGSTSDRHWSWLVTVTAHMHTAERRAQPRLRPIKRSLTRSCLIIFDLCRTEPSPFNPPRRLQYIKGLVQVTESWAWTWERGCFSWQSNHGWSIYSDTQLLETWSFLSILFNCGSPRIGMHGIYQK